MIARLLIACIATWSLSPSTAPAQTCGSADAPCEIDSGTYHARLPADGVAAKGIVMHLHGGGGNGCTNRQPSRAVQEGTFWWRHWEDCDAARIDLLIHPGGHGVPKGWSPLVMDWFEARLAE